MIGWNWWNPVLALAAVAVVGFFVARGVAGRGGHRAACWTHALMAIAMAGMFSPRVDPVPAPVGAAVFAVLGAWFAAVRLRDGAEAADEPAHIAVGSAAMVVMYLEMPAAGHGTGAAGHAGHAAAATGSAGLLLVALGVALAGYFVWHAWATAARDRQGNPDAGWGRTAVSTRARPETAAHVVLDALMAVMFLSAL